MQDASRREVDTHVAGTDRCGSCRFRDRGRSLATCRSVCVGRADSDLKLLTFGSPPRTLAAACAYAPLRPLLLNRRNRRPCVLQAAQITVVALAPLTEASRTLREGPRPLTGAKAVPLLRSPSPFRRVASETAAGMEHELPGWALQVCGGFTRLLSQEMLVSAFFRLLIPQGCVAPISADQTYGRELVATDHSDTQT